MINLIANRKKNSFNSKRKIKKDPNRFSFRANNEITEYLQKRIYDKSKFIQKALELYIKSLKHPKELLTELKKIHPQEWKYVNRRKFYPGGKFI